MKACYESVVLMMSVLMLSCISGVTLAGDAENEEDGMHHERHGKNSLGLFVGITREQENNRETLGIEYTYRINEFWSIGALIERAERDKSSTLTNVFVHLWPTEFLYLGVGYGRKDPGEERQHTGRVTIGYEFELGKGWLLSPQANIDFIEEEENEEVYGLVFGRRF